jgi:hypothetical protein
MSVWGSGSLEHLKECSKQADINANNNNVVHKCEPTKPKHIYSIEEITEYVEQTKAYKEAEYKNDMYYCYYLIFKEFLKKQPPLKDDEDIFDYAIESFKLWEEYFTINYWNSDYDNGQQIFESFLKKKQHNLTKNNINEQILKIILMMENYHY